MSSNTNTVNNNMSTNEAAYKGRSDDVNRRERDLDMISEILLLRQQLSGLCAENERLKEINKAQESKLTKLRIILTDDEHVAPDTSEKQGKNATVDASNGRPVAVPHGHANRSNATAEAVNPQVSNSATGTTTVVATPVRPSGFAAASMNTNETSNSNVPSVEPTPVAPPPSRTDSKTPKSTTKKAGLKRGRPLVRQDAFYGEDQLMSQYPGPQRRDDESFSNQGNVNEAPAPIPPATPNTHNVANDIDATSTPSGNANAESEGDASSGPTSNSDEETPSNSQSSGTPSTQVSSLPPSPRGLKRSRSRSPNHNQSEPPSPTQEAENGANHEQEVPETTNEAQLRTPPPSTRSPISSPVRGRRTSRRFAARSPNHSASGSGSRTRASADEGACLTSGHEGDNEENDEESPLAKRRRMSVASLVRGSRMD